MHCVGGEGVCEGAFADGEGAVLEEDLGDIRGFLQPELRRDFVKCGIDANKDAPVSIFFREERYGVVAMCVSGRPRCDFSRDTEGLFGEERWLERVDFGCKPTDVFPFVRSVSDAMVVLESAIRVPSNAVGALNESGV